MARMRMEYSPGSILAAGKLNLPSAPLATEMATVEPAFLAVTMTPSMAPSSAEVTCPLSSAAACANARDESVPACSKLAAKAAAVTSSVLRICMGFLPLTERVIFHLVFWFVFERKPVARRAQESAARGAQRQPGM